MSIHKLRRMRRIFELCSLISVATGCATVRNSASVDPSEMIAETREHFGIPAIGAVVLDSSNVLFMQTSGVRDLASGDPVSADDYYHLGSNTKAITAYIAGKLVQEGLLDWDSKLLEVVPELAEFARETYSLITLSDLLSHRARVQPYTSGAEFQAIPESTGSVTKQRVAFSEHIVAQPAVSLLFRRYAYSNAGYVLASAMIERVSGDSWETLVEVYIGKELGLRYVFGWPNVLSESQPWGHMTGAQVGDSSRGLVPLEPDFPYRLPEVLRPAGDISMPLADYARFVQLNLRGLRGSDGPLPAETFRELHYSLPGYSFGWEHLRRQGNTVSAHDGSAGTFYCHTVIVMEMDLAVVVLANSAHPPTVKGLYKLRDRLIDRFGR